MASEETQSSKEEDSEATLWGGPPQGFGLPGEAFIIFQKHPGTQPSDPLYDAPMNGLPGKYRVTFYLSRPEIQATPQRVIGLSAGRPGDSHLKLSLPGLPTREIELWIDLAGGADSFRFRALSNTAGHLAQLQTFPFHAQNRRDAELRATRAVQGLLSEQSARLDIPFHIQFIEVMEHQTFTKSVKAIALFPDDGTFENVEVFDPEFGESAALYREGLQSNSSVYRFLCFFKILEISRKRRGLPGKKSKAMAGKIRSGEVIPSSLPELKIWLGAIYAPRDWSKPMLDLMIPLEARGRKINSIADKEFLNLRHRIAHGILDSGQVLHLDDPSAVEEIAFWLPLLRCAVRRTLKNDFPARYLPYLTEDGTVRSDATAPSPSPLDNETISEGSSKKSETRKVALVDLRRL